MYKQYMDELRAKRAANFEARNVLKILWIYDMHSQSVPLQINQYWARNVHTAYVDELRTKLAANFEAMNVQNCVTLWHARQARCKITMSNVDFDA